MKSLKISERKLKEEFYKLNKKLAEERHLFTGVAIDGKGNNIYIYNGQEVGKEKYDELMRGGR